VVAFNKEKEQKLNKEIKGGNNSVAEIVIFFNHQGKAALFPFAACRVSPNAIEVILFRLYRIYSAVSSFISYLFVFLFCFSFFSRLFSFTRKRLADRKINITKSASSH
jgi:hypothetical protein